MKCFGLFLAAIVLLFVFPCTSVSQVPGVPSLGEFGSLEFGNITVIPSVKIGYRSTSLRLSFPVFGFPSTAFPPNWWNDRPSELTIKRASLLVGSVAVKVDAMSRIYLFGEATGNVSRNLTVSMPVSPWLPWPIGIGPDNPVHWNGTQLQWWLLDFGGGYCFRDNLSFLLGFRIDHFSVGLEDPVDTRGSIIMFPGNTLVGDIRTKMWIPYVGVALRGEAYEARIIYSPISWAEVKVPLQFTSGGVMLTFDQEMSHRLSDSGWYAGFDGVFRALAVDGFGLNVWASGSYSIIKGTGYYGWQEGTYGYWPDAATSTFVTSALAVGLTASFEF